MKTPIFPFTAVVGQDEFKLALKLNLIDPTIGGVLAIGDKGTGKTTLIRSLASLMSLKEEFPFVNLPIGATEDRLLGSINLETLINEKKEIVKPGLLNEADKGILYVDEVNLLQAHLMDVLLDASASGKYYLEREGISHQLDSRFCIVGSMNPEEGELRPQLKDRFGLGVAVKTPQDIEVRTAVVKARMAFDMDPEAYVTKWEQKENKALNVLLYARKRLRTIEVSDATLNYCSELAIKNGVEGLRADIILLKTAKAYTALNELDKVTNVEVDQIAELVLFHRRKINNSSAEPPPHPENKSLQNDKENRAEEKEPDDSAELRFPLNDFKRTLAQEEGQNGQRTSKHKTDGQKTIDISKTVGQYLATDTFKLSTRRAQHEQKIHHIFLLDVSGSMLAQQMNAYAKGTVEKLALKNKTQKTIYSVVALGDNTATIILNNNPILNQLNETLTGLETGGKTNIQVGLKKVKQLTVDPECTHHLTIVTDGKFSASGTIEQHILTYNTLCKGVKKVNVIDTEQGPVKLGMAKAFAIGINAIYEPLIV